MADKKVYFNKPQCLTQLIRANNNGFRKDKAGENLAEGEETCSNTAQTLSTPSTSAAKNSPFIPPFRYPLPAYCNAICRNVLEYSCALEIVCFSGL